MPVFSKILKFEFCEKIRLPYFQQHNASNIDSERKRRDRNRKTFLNDLKTFSKYFKPWKLRIKSVVLKEIGEDQQSLLEERERDSIDITIESAVTEDFIANKRKLHYDALCLKVNYFH